MELLARLGRIRPSAVTDSCKGQFDHECRTFSRRRLDPYLSGVHFDNDGVSETQTLTSTFSDGLGGEKWFKNAGADMLGNARSGVLDANFDGFRSRARGDED